MTILNTSASSKTHRHREVERQVHLDDGVHPWPVACCHLPHVVPIGRPPPSASAVATMSSVPYVSLGSRLLRETRDLTKYIRPGAGKRLLEWEEDRWGIMGRMPEHYIRYHKEWKRGPQEWIHTRRKAGRYEKDEFGQVVEIVNKNIHTVFYPDGFHKGLWGGEGVVYGLSAPKPSKHYPNYNKEGHKYWWPKLHHTVVYSEILDRHVAMVATDRGEWLVDKHHGLDFYLLETPVNEVYATDLLKLKRCMLLALARQTVYPDDDAKKKEVLDKYERFRIPEEEAQWHGLPLMEARERQTALERLAKEAAEVPRKHAYRKELLELLQGGYLEELDPALMYDDGDGGEKTLSEAVGKISKMSRNLTKKIKGS